jgi:prolyl-tRNA editing enzyme YbaK/EbsC (Cys-tRNA(Pro) deacylase)
VVVDRLVAEQDVVYTAAGEAGMILKVRGPDLVKATNALVVPVARPR